MPKVVDCKNVKVKKIERKRNNSIGHEVSAQPAIVAGGARGSARTTISGLTIKRDHNVTENGIKTRRRIMASNTFDGRYNTHTHTHATKNAAKVAG